MVDKIDKDKINKEEMQKCIDSPLYFYNTYCTINGEKVKPLTQEQWDERTALIKSLRCKPPLKFRAFYKDYPLSLKEIVIKKRNFLLLVPYKVCNFETIKIKQ